MRKNNDSLVILLLALTAMFSGFNSICLYSLSRKHDKPKVASNPAKLDYSKDFSPEECPVVGNIEKMIYHMDGCPNYGMMLQKNKGPDNRMCFQKASDAIAEGFKVSGNCSNIVKFSQ